jgi:hypothetical protein
MLVAQLFNPRMDLARARKGRKGADVLRERIFRSARGPDRRFMIIEDEFKAIARLEAEVLADLKGHGDLAFAADGAGWRHVLYLNSLQ